VFSGIRRLFLGLGSSLETGFTTCFQNDGS
jgi:hypothetical protein